MEPRLEVLARGRYLEQLWQDRPWGARPPWYLRWLGVLPRAYWEPSRDAVVVLEGHERDARLLAHEYGHALGLVHPPMRDWAYWLDVSGGVGPRLTDRHGLLRHSAAWRAAVTAPPAPSTIPTPGTPPG